MQKRNQCREISCLRQYLLGSKQLFLVSRQCCSTTLVSFEVSEAAVAAPLVDVLPDGGGSRAKRGILSLDDVRSSQNWMFGATLA